MRVRGAQILLLLCCWVSAGDAALADDDDDGLGSYERDALGDVLLEQHLELETDPDGKVLDRIHTVNLPVFSRRDGKVLEWFNVFHWTTREYVIDREVLLRPGDVWDQAKIDETERKLRDPIFTTLVVIVPVKSERDGAFDLLVITRDIWSLRMNSNFEFQESQLTYLTLSLSENNVFGYRKFASMVFEMGQGSYSIGPLYIDKNVFGKKLDFRTRSELIFNRQTSELEGSESNSTFSKPLWSLDSNWSASLQLTHRDAIDRVFQGTGLLLYDAPETRIHDLVPYEYQQSRYDIDVKATRALGKDVEHRFSAGYELQSVDYSVLDGFDESPIVTEAFERDVLPRSELTSTLAVGYRVFTPEFVVYRNVSTFDLPEDVRLGPDLNLSAGSSLELLGSDDTFLRGAMTASWVMDWSGRGFARAGTGASGRFQDGELIDNFVTGSVHVVTPPILRLGRLAARAELSSRINETGNRFLFLGGQSGLRGYIIGEFVGQNKLLANVELRSSPVKLWFMRAGALAFWDAGDATDELGDLVLHHDFGIGLRLLIPQLAPLLYRFDWAVATTGAAAGLPGRFTAGVGQAF